MASKHDIMACHYCRPDRVPMQVSQKSSARRIAFYLPHLEVGGAERVMVTLANSLSALGHDIFFILDQDRGPLRSALNPRVEQIPLHATRTFKAFGPLSDVLTQKAPDALLSALPHNSALAFAATRVNRLPIAIIAAEHTMPSRDFQDRPLAGQLLGRAILRLTYPFMDGLVAVSGQVAIDTAKLSGLPPSRIAIIGNPIITPDFPERAARLTGRPWFDQPDGVPVVLAVGRLQPVKDFPTLIAALALVNKRRPARLVILGEGPEMPALTTMAAQSGIGPMISLAGQVADPLPFYARANLLAVSSRYEGFGNTLVEAMAFGTPVVSTDCGGPREILEAGRLGPLVPPGDAQSLADAILTTLANPMPGASLIMAAKRFTASDVANRYLDVIEKAIRLRLSHGR